jgi:hypothetical protein
LKYRYLKPFSMKASNSTTLRNIPAAAEAIVRKQIEKLSIDHRGISVSEVTAEVPAPYTEGRYQIQIACKLPNHQQLVIDRQPQTDCYQEDLDVAIWSAFALARKQIRQHLMYSVSLPKNLQHS